MEGKDEKETTGRAHGKMKSDRISELPEPILHHILSFLHLRVAARTSILSKSWRQIWHAFPFFDFNQYYFGVDHKLDQTKEELDRKREYFINFVDERLERLCSLDLPIKQFGLVFRYVNAKDDFSCINGWLHLAAKRDLELLKISLFRQSSYGGHDFYIPQSVLAAARSLKVLELHGQCKLDRNFYVNSLPFSSLREVSLSWVCFADDGELIIRNIILSCPLIEDITLKFCYGLKCFHVWGLNKLKNVTVDLIEYGEHPVVERVHIDAPSLQSFDYGSITGKPCIVNIEVCKNIKWLTLRDDSDAIFRGKFDNIFTQFPLLETLHLWSCKMPEKVKISSHRLKNLSLMCCRGFVEAEIDTWSLLSFSYGGDTKPLLFLVNTSNQLEVKLQLTVSGYLGTYWFLCLRKFLGKLKLTKKNHLVLYIDSRQNHFNGEDLGEILLPPACYVDHLNLRIHSPSLDFNALFDGIYWSCNPQTVSVETCCHSFLKFVRERLLARGEDECSSSSSSSSSRWCESCTKKESNKYFWRHSLKEVKLESFPGFSDYSNHHLVTLISR